MRNNRLNNSQIVVSGIGPICSYATSIEKLSQLNFRGLKEAEKLDSDAWFEPRAFLGNRGFKYLTPATQYILSAARQAIEDASIQEDSYTPESRGVVIGTNFGLSTTLENLDRTILTQSADSLSPMDSPNFSINLPSGYVSMKYGFKSFNISLTSAIIAGIEAIFFGAHSIHQGRCLMALAGATEDKPPCQLEKVIGVPISEGAACAFILESLSSAIDRKAKLYSKIEGVSLRFFDVSKINSNNNSQQDLANLVRHEIDKLFPTKPSQIYFCPIIAPFRFNLIVNQIIQEEIQQRDIQILACNYVGGSGAFMSVSPMLQMATLISKYGEGLLIATSPQGHIAMLNLSKVKL